MVGAVATYGGLSLIQAAQNGAARAVAPVSAAPSADDQSQTAQQDVETEVARDAPLGDVALTTASMSALIQAQANLSKNAPALIRQHTAEALGRMIWSLDQAPPLSPAPMAVRQLQVARAALTQSLLDIRA